MKRYLLAAAVALIAIQGCKSDSPKGVAEKYLNSFYKTQYEEAKEFATPETQNILDIFVQFSSMMTEAEKAEAAKISVSIKEVKDINDSTAEVTYTTTNIPSPQRLTLVKRSITDAETQETNSKWLVKWTKEDMSAMELGGTTTPDGAPAPAPMQDTTPTVPDTTVTLDQ